MKQTYNWQDIYLFLAVARHTGLAGAAVDTKLSAATLSRRMTNLEHDLEQRLFERGARGYALTPAGKALFERAEKMEMAALEIGHLHNQAPVKRRIKISAGSWTMQLLLNNIGKYWSEDDNWLPITLGWTLPADKSTLVFAMQNLANHGWRRGALAIQITLHIGWQAPRLI